MYFLDTVSGLAGENLVSAVLKYLLLNSDRFRGRFTGRLAVHDTAPRNPAFRNGVLCRTEVSTESGRIDLLIESDTDLVAIENKLWAVLQPDQPRKYVPYLESEALRRYGDAGRAAIMIVAPGRRRDEIRKAVDAQRLTVPWVFVEWESLYEDLNDARSDGSGPVFAVAGFLREYLERHVGTSAGVDVPKGVLVGPTARIKSRYQYELLYRIRDLMPDPGKVASGRDHVGYSFRAEENERAPSHWIGFIRTAEQPDSRFEIHTAPLVGDAATPAGATDNGESYAGGRKWTLDVPDRATIEDWQNLLAPLVETLRIVTATSPQPEGTETESPR